MNRASRTMETNKKIKFLCPREEEKHEEAKKSTKIIIIRAENFPNLPRIPNKIIPKTSMLKHIIIKLLKTRIKENILIAAREKVHFIYGGKTI